MNDYVHIEAADLRRPNARFTTERQGYQVLTPFGKLGYSPKTGQVQLDRLAIGVPYQDKSNVGRWKGTRQDLRCRGNTWFMPYETIRDRASQRPHPATFPLQLPERCLRLHGVSRTNLVVDPFMGSGTTAVAAQRLNLPCIGFDVDEDYVRQAGVRLQEGEGQQRDLGFSA